MPLTPCFQFCRSPWIRPATFSPPHNSRIPLMLQALVPYFLRFISPIALSISSFAALPILPSLLPSSQMSQPSTTSQMSRSFNSSIANPHHNHHHLAFNYPFPEFIFSSESFPSPSLLVRTAPSGSLRPSVPSLSYLPSLRLSGLTSLSSHSTYSSALHNPLTTIKEFKLKRDAARARL